MLTQRHDELGNQTKCPCHYHPVDETCKLCRFPTPDHLFRWLLFISHSELPDRLVVLGVLVSIPKQPRSDN